MKSTSNVTLLNLIKSLFQRDTPKLVKLLTLAAVGYTVFPVDILPDVLGLFGWLDDAVVVTILTTAAMQLLEHARKKKAEPIIIND